MWEGKGTHKWELYKSSVGLIKYKVYWIPRKGKKIKIWEDNHPNLDSEIDLAEIRNWMLRENLRTMYEILGWYYKIQGLMDPMEW